MLKLIMIGETHKSNYAPAPAPPNLAKIGPAIAKLKAGDMPVKILSEGYFFSQHEKKLFDGEGAPQKPSELLISDLKKHFSAIDISLQSAKYCAERNLGAAGNCSISPIESLPLRQFKSIILQPAYSKKSALAMLLGLAEKSKENGYNQVDIQLAINDLDMAASKLESICKTWFAESELHTLEITAMRQLSGLFRSMCALFEKAKISGNSPLGLSHDFSRYFVSLFPFMDMALAKSNLLKDEDVPFGGSETLAPQIDIRAQIQAYYASAWLKNLRPGKFGTVATITGMLHLPKFLSQLKARIGERLQDFEPVVVLTDKIAIMENINNKLEKDIKSIDSSIQLLRVA
jgi:hypothetical protein